MNDFAALRQRMVDNQIRPGEVTDHDVIKAFLAVPREEFVAPAERPFAYADRELRMDDSAGRARMMMAPVQLARLVQKLPRGPETKAMVIGCGTGYSAAILARLTGLVIAVEENEALAQQARRLLEGLGAANVSVVTAPLVSGHPAAAPYGAILADGAVEVVPDTLIGQLTPEGSLAVIERDERLSRAMLYERIRGGDAGKWPLFEAWAALLPGFERKQEFVF
jgi:protein-L-isoaspartate(D-aspartate) O-methyltransferase